MKKSELISAALISGADKAEYIPAKDIILSAEFRKICQSNSCGLYGMCYMCPPDVGDIEELMDKVKQFPGGVLYQNIYPLDDSFDYEGMVEAANRHFAISCKLQKAIAGRNEGKVLHLTKGGCGYCKRCAKEEGFPCRFPEKALPSLEAYGIDVYNTSKATSLKYINGKNTVTYFGLVLMEFEDARFDNVF